jgi:hypothetical protein
MRFGSRGLLKLFRIGLVLCAVIILFPFPALAATAPFNLTTSPLPVLLSTTPGQTVATTLRIQNSGTQAINLKVQLKKFRASGSSGNPEILNQGPGDDYFGWVSFSQNSFTAQPGVWNQINMTVKVPSTAAFGYYYAVVFSKAGAVPTPSGTGSTITGGTAILVLLDVKAPGEKRQLNVASFTSDKKLYEYLPATFSIKVSNAGNIYAAPSGTIFINRGSKTIDKLDVNPAGGNVLPGTSRVYTASWNDGFPVFEVERDNGQVVSNKSGQPVYRLKWDFSQANRLRIGHYTARLVLVYNNGTQDVPIQGSLSFWVVPWKAIITSILLIIGLYAAHRWSVHRAVRRAQTKKVAATEPKK